MVFARFTPQQANQALPRLGLRLAQGDVTQGRAQFQAFETEFPAADCERGGSEQPHPQHRLHGVAHRFIVRHLLPPTPYRSAMSFRGQPE
jgi:hypothetical protein